MKTRLDQSREPKWSRVVILSFFLHLAVFSLFLFFPESAPTRKMNSAAVYEVNLVNLPVAKPKSTPRARTSGKAKKTVSSAKKKASVKRIRPPQRKKKPVVIGKRVVERKKRTPRKSPKPKKPSVSPSKLIDQAVAKIKKNVRDKKDDRHLDRAISGIKNRVKEDGTAGSGGMSSNGIAIRMYQMEVEERIKSNWQYPVALISPAKRKGLETTVVVKVKQDGTILKSWVLDRSGNAVFDGSVIKAVDRSNPLPPFPQGYNKSHDEVEIRFNLSELEEG